MCVPPSSDKSVTLTGLSPTDIEISREYSFDKKMVWNYYSIAVKIDQDVGVIESSTGKFLLNGIEVQSIQCVKSWKICKR